MKTIVIKASIIVEHMLCFLHCYLYYVDVSVALL